MGMVLMQRMLYSFKLMHDCLGQIRFVVVLFLACSSLAGNEMCAADSGALEVAVQFFIPKQTARLPSRQYQEITLLSMWGPLAFAGFECLPRNFISRS